MYIRAFLFVMHKSKILKFQKSSRSVVHQTSKLKEYTYILVLFCTSV